MTSSSARVRAVIRAPATAEILRQVTAEHAGSAGDEDAHSTSLPLVDVTPLTHRGRMGADSPAVPATSAGVFTEYFVSSRVRSRPTGHRLDLHQANLSVSAAGVIRGVHFTPLPPGQAKYVTCPFGAVLDVVVDLRTGSPTYGEWESVLLDDVDRRAVYLSEGLGHAFMALADGSVVTYLCSAPYAPSREHGVTPVDPDLAIGWPRTGRDGRPVEPLLSAKDTAAPTLRGGRRRRPAAVVRRGARPPRVASRRARGRVVIGDPATVERLLRGAGTWAVVGLSQDRSRDAYGIAALLQRLGQRIVPVHPRAVEVHGEQGYRTLAEIPDGTRVDVVDCFVNSSRVGRVVDDAIAERARLGIGAVWMQLGVVDEAAADRARAAGLDVVMDACPAIEAPRLGLYAR